MTTRPSRFSREDFGRPKPARRRSLARDVFGQVIHPRFGRGLPRLLPCTGLIRPGSGTTPLMRHSTVSARPRLLWRALSGACWPPPANGAPLVHWDRRSAFMETKQRSRTKQEVTAASLNPARNHALPLRGGRPAKASDVCGLAKRTFAPFINCVTSDHDE